MTSKKMKCMTFVFFENSMNVSHCTNSKERTRARIIYCEGTFSLFPIIFKSTCRYNSFFSSKNDKIKSPKKSQTGAIVFFGANTFTYLDMIKIED